MYVNVRIVLILENDRLIMNCQINLLVWLTNKSIWYWGKTAFKAMLSLDEEVRLYTTNAEREKYSLLATLFGVVVALDYLERAYIRDSITAAE